MRPVEIAPAGRQERSGDILRVLEQGPTSEADRVRDAEDSRGDGGSRATGHPLVPTGPVHRHRPEPDARDAVVEGIHASVSLVGLLVHPVMGRRVTLGGLLQPMRFRIRIRSRKRPDRAGVNKGRHPPPRPFDGFEQVDRADHVDECSERRIRTGERDLEGGQVDHVRDPVFGERPLDRRQVRDVAGDEGDRRQLVVGHDLGESPPVAAEVVGDDGDTLADERPDGPGTDAAKGAGDEEAPPNRLRVHAGSPGSSWRQTFSSRPIPSISTTMTSPEARNRGGLRKTPTPDGVPVAMMSPGSRVNACEQ